MENPVLSIRAARRLALARAGLLNPAWTGMPARAKGSGKRARCGAHSVLDRFGYLQLDTVSIAGARSHAIVLMSRLEGFDPALGERLLRPGEPVFEYWGHEASWLPIDLYPAMEFRRQEFQHHPWWGDVLGEHPELTERLRSRVREEGPLRSVDMEGSSGKGWWDLKAAKKVASALWSSGEWAVRERRHFQRTYDLAERVIPKEVRARPLSKDDGLEVLLLRALDGHGWAPTGTLARTWRLQNRKPELDRAMRRLVDRGEVVECALESLRGRNTPGWIRPRDLELVSRLERVRPRTDRGVLLSPFDPLLWDRARTLRLFDFEAVLEIFKPAPIRKYGYYCLPLLAGERLAGRFDLKADPKQGKLRILAAHFEATGRRGSTSSADRECATAALQRYADSLQLELAGWSRR